MVSRLTTYTLDVQLTLDDNNQIQYKLYRKKTDSRLYLKTDSFHPHHVFKSVIFSQMIRVIQRNSQDLTCVEDLAELKQDLKRSGHSDTTLEDTEPKAVLRVIENELYEEVRSADREINNKLVFSVKYFQEVQELKRLVNSVREDIKHLAGDVQITFALRKQPSIGDTVVRNRRLSDPPQFVDNTAEDEPADQKCHGKGCLSCPQLFNSNDVIFVNGIELKLDFRLTCKDKYVIYFAQCQICLKASNDCNEVAYFGQTTIPFHLRMNGHRDKFKINSNLYFEKSALSMHCYLRHRSQFSMSFFKLGIVKKVRPVDLDREEDKIVSKFRTKIWGLNRIVVVR